MGNEEASSTAQRERKRARDRDAQRAIRQKTSDRIVRLENTILELRRSHEANTLEVSALKQRTQALEETNALLRMRLREADLNIAVLSQGEILIIC